jgi:endogenous inhibitor of DNA gyrase (YacG/DUF329 family)
MPDEPRSRSGGRSQPRCPVCGNLRDQRFRPFCSARCRDQDLLNWLGGRYAIPAQESEADTEEDDSASG